MDATRTDNSDAQDPQEDLDGLATVLDTGLFGQQAKERFSLLRKNLTKPDGKGRPQDTILDRTAQGLQNRTIRLKDALKQYENYTDSRRWPIVVVRPNTEHKKLEDRLLGMGFQIVPSLASAYRQVGLIPLRVPPEFAFLSSLARRPDIQRIERSWMGCSIPEIGPFVQEGLLFPADFINYTELPDALRSKRDPLRIAILDSGLDARHPALQTRLIDQRSFQRNQERVGDRFGHGTACAGIVATLCPAATFISAKVLEPESARCNLDDLVRALGWIRRQRPDVVLCNAILPIETTGVTVLGSLLSDLVSKGIHVVVPAANLQGALRSPGCASGILSVATAESAPNERATILARGTMLRVPRSIQASKKSFPELNLKGWTSFHSPAASAATVAGTVALMIRMARLKRISLTPEQMREALLVACDSQKVIHLDDALQELKKKLHNMKSGLRPVSQSSPVSDVDLNAKTKVEQGLEAQDQHSRTRPWVPPTDLPSPSQTPVPPPEGHPTVRVPELADIVPTPTMPSIDMQANTMVIGPEDENDWDDDATVPFEVPQDLAALIRDVKGKKTKT